MENNLLTELILCAKQTALDNEIMAWDYGALNQGDGRWEQEKFRTLYTVILNACFDIKKEDPACSNFYAIVAQRVYVCLCSLPETTIAYENSGDNNLPVGTLGNILLYRDYRNNTTSDYIIVGNISEEETDAKYYRYIDVKGLAQKSS